MTKYVSLVAVLFSAILVRPANAQLGFPCDAFQMQPNGMLAVIRPVTITSPNGGQVSMGPGVSFGPGASMSGVNMYVLYQQYCR
jgi:hypothetical protein